MYIPVDCRNDGTNMNEENPIIQRSVHMKLDSVFPRYTTFDPEVPVWCLTPDHPGTIHRFFDTSPISPSGQYGAFTILASETELPKPGDKAKILLLDLHSGKTDIIAETAGWDSQLGAQVQWGRNDTELFFNDVDSRSREAYGVKMNPLSGERVRLGGTVYMISPDGEKAVSCCLRRIGRTQAGYGVIVPETHVPKNSGVPNDDYVFVTDTQSGECKKLISYQEIIETLIPASRHENFGIGDFYGFHTKWSPDGKRIMLVLRYLTAKRHYPALITMNADGSNPRIAVNAETWSKGGHHPNWCPDSQHILMNLKIDEAPLRFVKFRYDGSGMTTISHRLIGSGHPSFHTNGRYLITDSYQNEIFARPDGTTPIRFIDLHKDSEREIIRIRTRPHSPLKELRVDPHPVWDRNRSRIIFNASVDGKRRCYLADLSKLLQQ